MNRRRLLILGAGTSIAWSLAALAQQKSMPVIGFLGTGSPEEAAARLVAFHQGLGETGYVEGQNVAIEYRWAENHFDRLPALAADLVARKVDVIAAFAPPSTLAAKAATSTIAIVFNTGDDPVKTGLVRSLARPGGNLTGVSLQLTELVPKRLELLTRMVPRAGVIALLVNPNGPEAEPTIRAAEQAARERGVQLPILKAATENEIDGAFAPLAELRAGALLIGNDPFFNSRREQLVALSARYAVPAIYFFRDFAVSGGLVSYGPNITLVYRQEGLYVGKILNGAKPTDLPVEQPTKFELVINLKTAKALDLTVPQLLLAQADEVIE